MRNVKMRCMAASLLVVGLSGPVLAEDERDDEAMIDLAWGGW